MLENNLLKSKDREVKFSQIKKIEYHKDVNLLKVIYSFNVILIKMMSCYDSFKN